MRLAPALAACALAALAACSPSETRREVDKAEIQAALEAYLPVLGEVYASGDLRPLEGLAAEKEISRIRRRLEELAVQGRTLEPVLRRVTVEEVNVWNWANAYVTTLEVWDLRVVASGSDSVLAEEAGQHNRVKYQLKREGEAWRVLFRSIVE